MLFYAAPCYSNATYVIPCSANYSMVVLAGRASGPRLVGFVLRAGCLVWVPRRPHFSSCSGLGYRKRTLKCHMMPRWLTTGAQKLLFGNFRLEWPSIDQPNGRHLGHFGFPMASQNHKSRQQIPKSQIYNTCMKNTAKKGWIEIAQNLKNSVLL